MTKEEFKKMANILKDIKPTMANSDTEVGYYDKCRLFHSFLDRFNVAFILGNKKIGQIEFLDMINE